MNVETAAPVETIAAGGDGFLKKKFNWFSCNSDVAVLEGHRAVKSVVPGVIVSANAGFQPAAEFKVVVFHKTPFIGVVTGGLHQTGRVGPVGIGAGGGGANNNRPAKQELVR